MKRSVIRNTRIQFRSRKQGRLYFSETHSVVVCGVVTPGQVSTIMARLKDGHFFVPEEVGIPFRDRSENTERFCAIGKASFTPTCDKEDTTTTMCEIVGAFKKLAV